MLAAPAGRRGIQQAPEAAAYGAHEGALAQAHVGGALPAALPAGPESDSRSESDSMMLMDPGESAIASWNSGHSTTLKETPLVQMNFAHLPPM